MGYSPRALATWIRHTGGVPSPFGGDPVSHMLRLERDEPEVASAARWYLEPVDYLTMRFTGRAAATHASMSAAWLTDNRRLDRLEYDPVLVRRARPRRRQAAAPGRDRLADRPGPPGGRLRARHQPGRAGRHRDARPAFGGARLRGDRRRPGAHDDQHHLVDLAAVSAARRPTRCTRSRPFPGSTRAATWSRTTTRPPGSACAGCATASRSASRASFERLIELADGIAARQRRGHLHALDRRGALAGRRPQRPRRLAQPLGRDRQRRPDPLGARGRRLQQPLAERGGGGVREAAARPAPHLRRRGDP